MSLTKSVEQHVHRFEIPGRKTRTDRPDGKQFLIWSCSCGEKYASDLLTREQIDEVAQQYAKRKGNPSALLTNPQTPLSTP